jgi:hypothetical protein
LALINLLTCPLTSLLPFVCRSPMDVAGRRPSTSENNTPRVVDACLTRGMPHAASACHLRRISEHQIAPGHFPCPLRRSDARGHTVRLLSSLTCTPLLPVTTRSRRSPATAAVAAAATAGRTSAAGSPGQPRPLRTGSDSDDLSPPREFRWPTAGWGEGHPPHPVHATWARIGGWVG